MSNAMLTISENFDTIHKSSLETNHGAQINDDIRQKFSRIEINDENSSIEYHKMNNSFIILPGFNTQISNILAHNLTQILNIIRDKKTMVKK
jgi:hypothetical protein